MPNAGIEKYLTTHSESLYFPQVKNLPGKFEYCVVVPAKNETDYLARLFESLKKAQEHSQTNVLVLFVVNQQEKDSELYLKTNLETYTQFKVLDPSFTIFPIDAFSKNLALPEKQGVGLARKIGCDLALYLYSNGQIEAPFVFTTDADAKVPLDYFTLKEIPGTALVHRYVHVPSSNEKTDRATVIYETWLRYYSLGLIYADSPYGYPSVGSLLAIDFQAYASVRGFPKKEAGEDFYLLNKLSKLGKITIRDTTIELMSRTSNRVPFGTGKGVLDILSLPCPEDRPFYDPKTFEVLKRLLFELRHFPLHRSTEMFLTNLWASVSNLLNCERALFDALMDALKIAETLSIANKTRPKNEDCLRHLMSEFDGFKTLRMIHILEEWFFPHRKINQIYREAPFLESKSTLEELRTLENLKTAQRTFGWDKNLVAHLGMSVQ